MALATKDAMAPFLREVLPTLVEVRGSGNKVCGSYCAECIDALVALVSCAARRCGSSSTRSSTARTSSSD
ncbi:hypothetical protein PINS_up022844 [Pythium insidiosum]|nr:hypothetical protein PINS_up022844 [Pythium insidiosum]